MLPQIKDSSFLLTPPTRPSAQRSAQSGAPSNAWEVQIAPFEEQCAKFESLAASYKPKSSSDDKSYDKMEVGEEPSEDLGVVKAVHLLLPMLLDLYTELNGTSARLKCIEAIQRIVCNVSPFVLSWVISPRAVSAMVADMLGNPEFSLIAAGIQLVNIFVVRVPNVFASYFRKEGVLFHLKRLTSLDESEVESRTSGVVQQTAPAAAEVQPSTSGGDAPETPGYHLRSSDYVTPPTLTGGRSGPRRRGEFSLCEEKNKFN